MDGEQLSKMLSSPLPLSLFGRGKRPITIRGPLHIQCATMMMVEQSIASFNRCSLPDIEADPLPVSSADLVSL